MDRIDLAKDKNKWIALVNAVMNLEFLVMLGNYKSGCTTVGFLSSAQLHFISWLVGWLVGWFCLKFTTFLLRVMLTLHIDEEQS
jgi:hypothetical protein